MSQPTKPHLGLQHSTIFYDQQSKPVGYGPMLNNIPTALAPNVFISFARRFSANSASRSSHQTDSVLRDCNTARKRTSWGTCASAHLERMSRQIFDTWNAILELDLLKDREIQWEHSFSMPPLPKKTIICWVSGAFLLLAIRSSSGNHVETLGNDGTRAKSTPRKLRPNDPPLGRLRNPLPSGDPQGSC